MSGFFMFLENAKNVCYNIVKMPKFVKRIAIYENRF